MTYRFNWLNNDLDIVDPILEIDPDGLVIFPSKMMISVPIKLETDSAKFGIFLEEVVVNDFNYDADQLEEKVLVRLQDFIVDA